MSFASYRDGETSRSCLLANNPIIAFDEIIASMSMDGHRKGTGFYQILVVSGWHICPETKQLTCYLPWRFGPFHRLFDNHLFDHPARSEAGRFGAMYHRQHGTRQNHNL
jgi:hypothetical protein